MQIDLIELLKQLLELQNIRLTLLTPSYVVTQPLDLGLRENFLENYDSSKFIQRITADCTEANLSFIMDSFYTNYVVFLLPETEYPEHSYVLIGPYCYERINKGQISEIISRFPHNPSIEGGLCEYYNALPLIEMEGYFESFLFNMVSRFYPEDTLKVTHYTSPKLYLSPTDHEKQETEIDLSYNLIEQRYQVEKDLLQAIATGNSTKALEYLERFLKFRISPRTSNPLRDKKNLLIVQNTLYRKAAQEGCVHPYKIDEISASYAKKIEEISSSKEADKVSLEMTRKYSLLVNNYSLKGYSATIQSVINYIMFHLNEPLSLKHLADYFSMNSSYLSTLFKKEVGVTLTDYIIQQKIRHAIFLLNQNHMQIQEVAVSVGIPDVNYFIKLFKKINGVTPKEYRDSIFHKDKV